jgi:Zn-dependent membrane protease YugP
MLTQIVGIAVLCAVLVLIGAVARRWLLSVTVSAEQVAIDLSGAAAARRILDAHCLAFVPIEQTPGVMSHYDSRPQVLRLTEDVYHGRSLAAMTCAALVAQQAIAVCRSSRPLALLKTVADAVSRHGKLPAAFLLLASSLEPLQFLLPVGLIAGCGLIALQSFNLVRQSAAGRRIRHDLVEMGIARRENLAPVARVLRALTLTYAAALLQSVLVTGYLTWMSVSARAASQ